jgi:acyl carrier protein
MNDSVLNRKELLTAMAMQGLLAGNVNGHLSPEVIGRIAVDYANAVLEKLDTKAPLVKNITSSSVASKEIVAIKMATIDNVAQRVTKCIINETRRSMPEPSGLYGSSLTMKDMGIDSLDAIECIMAIEEEFNIELSDEDIEKCNQMGDVYSLVIKKLQEKSL